MAANGSESKLWDINFGKQLILRGVTVRVCLYSDFNRFSESDLPGFLCGAEGCVRLLEARIVFSSRCRTD